jgi:hypothetical protein
MPAYFEETRFRNVKEVIVEVPSRPYAPQTHELNPRRTAVQPLDPTLKQGVAVNGPSLLDLAIRTAKGYVELRKNEAKGRVRDEIVPQLPAGQDYTLVITNPGGWGGPESVEVYQKGQFPGAIHSPYTEVYTTTVQGQKRTGGATSVEYTNPQGQTQNVPIHFAPQVSAPPPRRSPPRNVVDREPRGFREPRQLPADARFDRDYPGHRDPSRIA